MFSENLTETNFLFLDKIYSLQLPFNILLGSFAFILFKCTTYSNVANNKILLLDCQFSIVLQILYMGVASYAPSTALEAGIISFT